MDSILYWNDVALEANRVSHTNGKGEQTGPVLSARALAIVHLAMFDAYAGLRGNPTAPVDLSAYLPGLPPAPAAGSLDAAVASAALGTLTVLFPSQRAFFTAKHAAAGLSGPGLAEGHAYGLAVARSMLADRAADPTASDVGYVNSTARGHHREDPDNLGQGVNAPFYGDRARSFAVAVRPTLAPPPALGSAEYLAALRDVRQKGITPEGLGSLPAGSSPRTPDEALKGVFWAYDGAFNIGTPPRLYNQIVRALAVAKNNSTDQNARLFALVNAAMADAGISAWEAKFSYDLWRPVVGLREHDASLGPSGTGGATFSADADPCWLPFGAPRSNVIAPNNTTPNFPAYPSGHATFGAAAFHITRLFYGVTHTGPDTLLDGLQFVSDELDGITRDHKGTLRPRQSRSFPGGLWQMIEENSRSRVFLGVHWVFDGFLPKTDGTPDLTQNVGGVPLGLAIASDIFANGLKRSSAGPLAPASAPGSASPSLQTLRITVDNLAPPNGGVLSSLWFGFHEGTYAAFELGQPASAGLQRLAEDGNAGTLSNEFIAAGKGVVQGVAFGSSDVLNSIFPGTSASAVVQIDRNSPKSRYFSYAVMVIPSNDAFVANGNAAAHQVFDASGALLGVDIIVPGSAVLDAGTEVNDEAAFNAAGAGPILIADAGVAENGLVHVHAGYVPGGTISSIPFFANANFKAPGYQVARIRISAV